MIELPLNLCGIIAFFDIEMWNITFIIHSKMLSLWFSHISHLYLSVGEDTLSLVGLIDRFSGLIELTDYF